MSSIDDIISTAKFPEQTIRLCTRGDLIAEHVALSAEFATMPDAPQSHLAAADPRAPLAQEIVDLETRMRDTEVPFTFRALGRRKYRELLEEHPGEPGVKFDLGTFPRALIAACAVDPVMTPTDVDRLFDVLNEGAVEVLFMGAYTINEGVSRVPFSVAASELTRRRETKP